MIAFEFTIEDLAQTRFAVSPMWELVTSLRMLRDPGWAAMHVAWVREAVPAARGLDLRAAFALTPTRGYIPDFLTPPPSSPVVGFEEELERLRATSAAQVRADIAMLFGRRAQPDVVAAIVAHPRRELDRLADRLAEYWQATLEPHWPRIRALLEADIAYRAKRLTTGGPASLFADLHHSLAWHGERLEVESSCADSVALDGRGLLLAPSAFGWQTPACMTEPPFQPTVFYPARGVSVLWDAEREPSTDALAGVVGETRARMLALLGAPRSTTELAGRLEQRAGGVSQHLKALRAAGLVSSSRDGRTVLYVRTPIADRLVGAPAADAG